MSSFRQTLQFYLIDCKTPLGKGVDVAIIGLNLLICALFVAETFPISPWTHRVLWGVEMGVTVLFIVEYMARIYAADNRVRQVLDIYSIIDLAAILPTVSLVAALFFGVGPNLGFLRVIRGIRVFRIFRFLRFTADPVFFFGTISRSWLRVLRLSLTIAMIFFICSGLFFQAENQINPKVRHFGDAFYFSVVTLTTVGFGDIAPISDAGRMVTVLMILSGIIFIPWQISHIVREWARMSQKKEVICKGCGLTHHDPDASHCKACGRLIYQEYPGD